MSAHFHLYTSTQWFSEQVQSFRIYPLCLGILCKSILITANLLLHFSIDRFCIFSLKMFNIWTESFEKTLPKVWQSQELSNFVKKKFNSIFSQVIIRLGKNCHQEKNDIMGLDCHPTYPGLTLSFSIGWGNLKKKHHASSLKDPAVHYREGYTYTWKGRIQMRIQCGMNTSDCLHIPDI